MTSPGRRCPGWLVALGMLAAVYLAGTGAVLFFAPPGDPVATWWPAAGLAVALLGLAPRRHWLALAVGVAVLSGLGNLSGGRDVLSSACYGVANASEAVVAAAVLRRGGREGRGGGARARLEGIDDFIRLLLAALAGALTIATGAALTVALLGTGPFSLAWRSVFTSHAASTLVLVPVAMTLGPRWTGRWSGRWSGPGHGAPTRPAVRRDGERVCQLLALVTTTLLVFGPHQPLPITYLPLPLLLWAALRFDLRTVTWQLAGLSVLVTLLTARGFGPFGGDPDPVHRGAALVGLLAQGYLLCAAVMSLPLAIAAQQRRELLERTRSSERLFRRNFTESVVGMLLLRGVGERLEVIDVNDTAARLLGAARASLVGAPLAALLDCPEPVDEVAARIRAGELEGWKARTGLRGNPRARVNVALSVLSGGQQPMFSMQLQDVTAEHEALRRLEQAEKLTSATLDTTACIILVTDLGGTIVRVNSATTDITGYTAAELLGRPVWETPISPATADDVGTLLGTRDSTVTAARESDGTTRDGERLRILWNSDVVRDEEDHPLYAVMTGIDVTAERAATAMTVNLLEAAITTALIGVDNEGRVSVFNAGAQHLLGYHHLEMLGRPFVEVLEPDQLRERTGADGQAAAFEALVGTIGADGEAGLRDWTWVCEQGRHATVSMTLTTMYDAAGARTGYLCIGRDVTEQRQSQEMLVAALDKERMVVERLRALDRAKNEFVSTVSHELRTPVTSIVGYTEMLQDGSVVEAHPDQLPLLQTIARNGERLIVICNDLLLLSGLDSGAARWEKERFDLAELLEPVEQAVRSLMWGRDLDLRVVGVDAPLPVVGDRGQLERVLLNLLGNAVKFTDDGGEITCSLQVVDDEAVLTVSDTGIGIPEDEQDGLFEKFFRSSTARSRAIQGTGLGLSIVASIVAAHAGTIEVRSAHLRGTTFTVRLPLARTSAPRRPERVRPGSRR